MAAPEGDLDTLPTYLLRSNPANKLCMDCPSEKVTHVCLDLDTFVCRTCSAIHKKFGRDTKSVMAMFTTEERDRLISGGNRVAELVYLNGYDGETTTPYTEPKAVAKFMKDKYTTKKWYNPDIEEAAREAMRADNASNEATQIAVDTASAIKRLAVPDIAGRERAATGGTYGIAKGNAVRRRRSASNAARARSDSLNSKIDEFIIAADNGHIRSCESAIAGGLDVNISNSSGVTALHRAAAKGRLEVVTLLLSKGAAPNAQDKWHDTPLHKASHNGHLAIIEALINAGGNVNMKNTENQVPLSVAQRSDVKELLISKGALPPSQVEQTGSAIDRLFPGVKGSRARSYSMPSALDPSLVAAGDEEDPFSGFEARAIYDFKAEFGNELDVSKGQIVKVVNEHPAAGQGWWLVSRGSQEGLVPASYLEIVKDAPRMKPKRGSRRASVIAQSDNAPPPASTEDAPAVVVTDDSQRAAPKEPPAQLPYQPPNAAASGALPPRAAVPSHLAGGQRQRPNSIATFGNFSTINETPTAAAPPAQSNLAAPAAAPAKARPVSADLLDLDWSMGASTTTTTNTAAPAQNNPFGGGGFGQQQQQPQQQQQQAFMGMQPLQPQAPPRQSQQQQQQQQQNSDPFAAFGQIPQNNNTAGGGGGGGRPSLL